VFFEIVFGLVSLLVLIACVNLWLKSSRVIINSSGVTARNRWLLDPRKNRLWLQTLSHKGLRLLTPVLLLATLARQAIIGRCNRVSCP